MKVAATYLQPVQPQAVTTVGTFPPATTVRGAASRTAPGVPHAAFAAAPADQWSRQQKLLIGAGAGGLGGVGVAMIFQALHGASSHVPGLPVVVQAGELLIGGAVVGTAGGALWGAGMGGKHTMKGYGFTYTAEQTA